MSFTLMPNNHYFWHGGLAKQVLKMSSVLTTTDRSDVLHCLMFFHFNEFTNILRIFETDIPSERPCTYIEFQKLFSQKEKSVNLVTQINVNVLLIRSLAWLQSKYV